MEESTQAPMMGVLMKMNLLTPPHYRLKVFLVQFKAQIDIGLVPQLEGLLLLEPLKTTFYI